jgi:hypothetical protein
VTTDEDCVEEGRKLVRVNFEIVHVVVEPVHGQDAQAFLDAPFQAGSFVGAEIEAPRAAKIFEQVVKCTLLGGRRFGVLLLILA